MDYLDLKTSGCALADRRYGYAAMLREAGDLAAAVDLFRQTVEIAPAWAPGWVALGDAELARGAHEPALEAWRRALAADAEDRMGVALRLARAGLAVAPETPPEGWVRALFDDYAPGFDRALVERLGYGTPAVIGALLDELRPDAVFPRVLDLGCGTGLTGEVLRRRAGWLEGVDLAPGMLAQARAKGVFDALTEDEAVRFLSGPAQSCELIAAGDVAPYLGALEPLVSAAAARLAPGGLFVLSIEAAEAEGPDWRLRETLRYAHRPAYLARAAAEAGLETLALRPTRLRRDGGAWVEGAVAVFLKGSTTAPVELPAAWLEAVPLRAEHQVSRQPRSGVARLSIRAGVARER